MTTARAGAADLMTAEELFELPDDGMRHELIEGELRSMAPAGKRHGRIARNVLYFVDHHVRTKALGECYAAETGFVVRRDPDTVRAPDLAFVATGRDPEPDDPSFATIVPDLVVEVVSPSDRASEVTAKAVFWLDAGVRSVWVIDPGTRTVTVHGDGAVVHLLRGDEATLTGGDVLPGFTVRLGDLFA